MPSKPAAKKPERKSLTEFAKGHRKIVAGNWLTTIPEWPEVLAAWEAGVSTTSIRRWLLEECGYDPEDCTDARVAYVNKAHPRRHRG